MVACKSMPLPPKTIQPRRFLHAIHGAMKEREWERANRFWAAFPCDASSAAPFAAIKYLKPASGPIWLLSPTTWLFSLPLKTCPIIGSYCCSLAAPSPILSFGDCRRCELWASSCLLFYCRTILSFTASIRVHLSCSVYRNSVCRKHRSTLCITWSSKWPLSDLIIVPLTNSACCTRSTSFVIITLLIHFLS